MVCVCMCVCMWISLDFAHKWGFELNACIYAIWLLSATFLERKRERENERHRKYIHIRNANEQQNADDDVGDERWWWRRRLFVCCLRFNSILNVYELAHSLGCDSFSQSHIFVQSTIYTHFYSPTIKHDATNDGLVQRCDAFTVSLELNVKPLERL